MIIGICAGGPLSEINFLQCDKWIGVDRGAIYLIENGLELFEVIGDFDSVSNDEWKQIIKRLPNSRKLKPEKDETDTEIAIDHAVKLNPKKIFLTGVTGGRLDHFEAALRVLIRYQLRYPDIKFEVVNNQNKISVLTNGKHRIKKEGYKYISFFAMAEPVHDVTLQGVKYETTNETISPFSSKFTSNEILGDDAYITFSSGICLVVRSDD